MKLNKQSHYLFFYSSASCYAALYNRSSQAKWLDTYEADEVFNVAENKTKSITDIFFRSYYLDLGSMQLHSWEMFAKNFFKIFS